MAGRTFHATLVTPESIVLDTEVVLAIIPAQDGQLGIMAHHAPVVTKMNVGVLKLETPTEIQRYVVAGGYAQMENNILTILTDSLVAQTAVNNDLISAEQAKAQTIPLEPPPEAQRRKQALARVAALRKLASGE